MLIYTKNLFKNIFILLILGKTISFKFNISTTNITEISSYLQHFNNEFFLHKTSQISVIRSAGEKRAGNYLNELLSEYLKTLNLAKIKLKDVNNKYKSSFAYFNVIFIDSYESFQKIDHGFTTQTEDYSEYLLIVYYSLHNNPEQEIQKIFDYCWQFYTVNVALLLQTQEEKPILLYTYYPFTPKSCQNVQMHIINQNKSILQLKSSEFFPYKFKNFYNCNLTAALWNVPPYLTLPESNSISEKMAGIEGFLLNVLSEVLQFKINYIVPPNNEQRGLVKADGSLTGAIKMLNERIADLSLGSFRCTLSRSTALSPSMTFYQTMQVFTVLALRQPWTSLEIIAYPFQLHIWIVLFLLVIFLLTFPFFLQYYRPNVVPFIYGFRSVYFININIIAIALNQTAISLPRRNFSRYIFLMWILLTMILRSIYQGALYDFLKTQQTLAPPDTVAELTQRKYELIVNVATHDTFSGIQVIRDNLIKVLILNISDDGGFPLLEAHPNKNYVTGTPKDFLLHYVNTHNKYGVFHVLKETIFSQHLCVYFTKHSYLVKTFNHLLQNLRNFGLIDYWAKQFTDNRFLENVNDGTRETPLTLNQLLGIMEICMILYLLAFIVFACEIFWFKLITNNNVV